MVFIPVVSNDVLDVRGFFNVLGWLGDFSNLVLLDLDPGVFDFDLVFDLLVGVLLSLFFPLLLEVDVDLPLVLRGGVWVTNDAFGGFVPSAVDSAMVVLSDAVRILFCVCCVC